VRRYHIQQNVTQLVIEYARHERDLHTRLTRLRMRKSETADKDDASARATKSPRPQARARTKLEQIAPDKMTPEQLNKVFPQIKLMAEQYPQLRLSENFQQFSKAIIDTEDKITDQIMSYNKAVNDISSTLRQFPGNLFGLVCGFHHEDYWFYEPDKDRLGFRPVSVPKEQEKS
jgi:LemA protein